VQALLACAAGLEAQVAAVDGRLVGLQQQQEEAEAEQQSALQGEHAQEAEVHRLQQESEVKMQELKLS